MNWFYFGGQRWKVKVTAASCRLCFMNTDNLKSQPMTIGFNQQNSTPWRSKVNFNRKLERMNFSEWHEGFLLNLAQTPWGGCEGEESQSLHLDSLLSTFNDPQRHLCFRHQCFLVFTAKFQWNLSEVTRSKAGLDKSLLLPLVIYPSYWTVWWKSSIFHL